MIRINKFLSVCGITSRRGAEKLIDEGRVTVNDEKVDKQGAVIDEKKDIVKVDGNIIRPAGEKYYILLNKPKNVLTSLSDPFQRRTVAYFTKKVPSRVYPVGRLDFDTQGALLLTNDGDLAYRLAHPSYEINRIYRAVVMGAFTEADCRRVEQGIELEDGHIGRARVKILRASLKTSLVELTLHEGHKREVKQLLKGVGHQVRDLARTEFAGLTVTNLKAGRWRHLNKKEVRMLKAMVGLAGETRET
nr:rRNA pseudouridine synthase [candidate division Zixibacteria bacterium]